MKEALISGPFLPVELEMLHLVDRASEQLVGSSGLITPTQLYAQLQRWNQDHGLKLWEFQDLVERGLLAGYLDWNLCPDGPFTPVSAVQRGAGPARELWVANHELGCWATQFAVERDLACVVLSPSMSVFGAYETLNRIWERRQAGQAVALVLGFAGSDGQANATFAARVQRMLRTRQARELFNRQEGSEIWGPEGVRVATDSPGCRKVNQAVNQARELPPLLDVRVLGQHGEQSVELSQMRPDDLARLIDRSLEPVPGSAGSGVAA